MIHRRFGIPARRVAGLPAMLRRQHRIDEKRRCAN
jgi:hypothetical protein